jgi:nitroreductase
MTKINKPAETSASLNPLVANRFSPRIHDANHVLTGSEIESLGEAFRWAPSSMNQQPWKLIFATRGSELFNQISERGLTGFNQTWAPKTSAYAVVLARQTEDGKPRDKAATYFDLGLASQQLAIQAEHMGLRAHYMGGILHEEIAKIVGATDHWVVVVITIGLQGELEGNEEAIIERETAVRNRKPSVEIYQVDTPLA